MLVFFSCLTPVRIISIVDVRSALLLAYYFSSFAVEIFFEKNIMVVFIICSFSNQLLLFPVFLNEWPSILSYSIQPSGLAPYSGNVFLALTKTSLHAFFTTLINHFSTYTSVPQSFYWR